jgi:hypothetical protein
VSTVTEAFTSVAAHPIDELDEAGIGTHLLHQDWIGSA